jgi:hypothetical protein
LVAYFEKELGGNWPDLVDRLAGGGIVLGGKFGEGAPALIVVQSKDETLLRRFVQIGTDILEQELARQESKEKVEKGKYRDIETVKLGKDMHAAIAGSALLISNKQEVLHLGLDRHLDGGQKSLATVASVGEARKLLPAEPLAWLWLNLETVKQTPQGKEILTHPRNDVNLTVLFGGWLDAARRSSFICAGLHRQEKGGFLTTIRMPAGLEGMPEELSVHIPPKEGAGALPLLEPKGVVFSTSYYLDLSKFWEHRSKLFNEQQMKGFEEADKAIGRFLAGNKLSKLLTQAGAHQRFVVAHSAKSPYTKVPGTRFPAFGLVIDMREPDELGRAIEVMLRGAALATGAPYRLKLVEEKHGDLTIVGYKFSEDAKVEQDPGDIRFNFSPCFVAVGDQFMMASTLELGHELVDILQQEARAGRKTTAHAVQTRFYGAGGADLLQAAEDQLLTQTILDRALPPAEAKEQVKKLIALVRSFGNIDIESAYGQRDFRYEFKYAAPKTK